VNQGGTLNVARPCAPATIRRLVECVDGGADQRADAGQPDVPMRTADLLMCEQRVAGMDSFTYVANNGFSNSLPATVSMM